MTIEQEQKCAIEALSRASDVTQRLMFREGAKWMGAEHAAALAKAEERVRELEEALAFIRDCEDDGEEFGPIVTVGFLKEQARAALEGK